MPKKESYYIPASKWLELSDEFSRWYYHPRKITQKELQEFKHGVQSDDPTKSKAPLSSWEIKYAMERVNKARLNLKRDSLSRNAIVKIVAERVELPEKAVAQWDDRSLRTAYKGLFKKAEEELGHTENLYWYMNAAKQAGIDPDLIERLDAIHEYLSPAEIDQLYQDLPDLTLYYQSVKGDKKGSRPSQETSDLAVEEWNVKIDKILRLYERAVKERNKKD